MTHIPSIYRFDGIAENSDGEPLAKFRRGGRDFFERLLKDEIVETIQIDLPEIERQLDQAKRTSAFGARPETTLVLSAERSCRIHQFTQAKQALLAWPHQPPPDATETTRPKINWADVIFGALQGSLITAFVISVYMDFHPTPDVGVYFHSVSHDAFARIPAIESGRDLGAFSEDKVKEAATKAVEAWFKGKKGLEIVELPETPELNEQIRIRNHWCKGACGPW